MNNKYVWSLLPILQLYRPWSNWIINEWKTIETRTHNKFAWTEGKTVAIYSCKKFDKFATFAAAKYLTSKQILESEVYKEKEFGGFLIGTADVSEYRLLTPADSPAALIDCSNVKRYGLFLSNIKRIQPYPFQGSQVQKYIDLNQLRYDTIFASSMIR
jgi:hypothetical protein